METVKSFIGGIAATVVGGLLLFYILQQQGFFPNNATVATDSDEVVAELAPVSTSFSFYAPKLRFYESDDSGMAYESRTYQDSFPQQTTRYVNWELEIKYGTAPTRRSFHILAIYTKANGEELSRMTANTYADKDWDNSFHNWGWGWAEAGKWEEGAYTVALFIGGNEAIKR